MLRMIDSDKCGAFSNADVVRGEHDESVHVWQAWGRKRSRARETNHRLDVQRSAVNTHEL